MLLNRTVTARRNYKRGDIVTLYCPNDPNRLITKRILALGGDTVRVWVPRGMDLAPASSGRGRADVVSLAYTDIYQKALRELASEIEDHASGAWLSITIPPQYAWVEGDASAHAPTQLSRLHPDIKSRDSREFGPVPLGLITSRVEYILWPLARFGRPPPHHHESPQDHHIPVPRALLERALRQAGITSPFDCDGSVCRLAKPVKPLTNYARDDMTLRSVMDLARRLVLDKKLWKTYVHRMYTNSLIN